MFLATQARSCISGFPKGHHRIYSPLLVSTRQRCYHASLFIPKPERDIEERVRGRGEKISKLKTEQSSATPQVPKPPPPKPDPTFTTKKGLGGGKIEPKEKHPKPEAPDISEPASSIIEKLTSKHRARAKETQQLQKDSGTPIGSKSKVFDSILENLTEMPMVTSETEDKLQTRTASASTKEFRRKRKPKPEDEEEIEEGQFDDVPEDEEEMSGIAPADARKRAAAFDRRFDERLSGAYERDSMEPRAAEDELGPDQYGEVPYDEKTYSDEIYGEEQYDEQYDREQHDESPPYEMPYDEEEAAAAMDELEPRTKEKIGKKIFESYEMKQQRLLREMRSKMRKSAKEMPKEGRGSRDEDELTALEFEAASEYVKIPEKEIAAEIEPEGSDITDYLLEKMSEDDSQRRINLGKVTDADAEKEEKKTNTLRDEIEAEFEGVVAAMKKTISQFTRRFLAQKQRQEIKKMKIKRKREIFIMKIQQKYAEQIAKRKAARAERKKKLAEEREKIKNSPDYCYYPEIDYYVPKKLLQIPIIRAGFATVLDNPSLSVKQKRHFITKSLRALKWAETADEKTINWVKENLLIESAGVKEKNWRLQLHNLKIPIYNWNQLTEKALSQLPREDLATRYTTTNLIKRYATTFESQKAKRNPWDFFN
jgi:hypothetical protein